MKITKHAFWVLFFWLSAISSKASPILNTDGTPHRGCQDILARLLHTHPLPQNVFDLRSLFKDLGLQLSTTLVANRGFHNPGEGSFSFFEWPLGRVDRFNEVLEPGDLFFGHFVNPRGIDLLEPDQAPDNGKLMVELLVRDPSKGYYNFYELIGTGASGQWVYRGDSKDILNDLVHLERQPDPKNPNFGERLRCSGCHMHGGPIMKEMFAPHNDWWTPDRGLNFGRLQPDAKMREIMSTLTLPEALAAASQKGMERMRRDGRLDAVARTLQERMRPLFAPVELNIESDLSSLDAELDTVKIPSSFFVDPRLASKDLEISKKIYLQSAKAIGQFFPENKMLDADHAWLVPVKAVSDQRALDPLRSAGIIDADFETSILSIDFTNPLFSAKRMGLLRFLPNDQTADWKAQFQKNLDGAAQDQTASAASRTSAKEVLEHLRDPRASALRQKTKVRNYLEAVERNLKDPSYVRDLLKVAAQRRREVFDAEISKNPRGQILEPGFRVIFPELNPPALSAQWEIHEDGEIAPTITP